MVCCFSRQSLLHSSPPTPLRAFFSSVSKGPYKLSLSPHKIFLWVRFCFFLPELFFPGIEVINDASVGSVGVGFFSTSKRSLDGGTGC